MTTISQALAPGQLTSGRLPRATIPVFLVAASLLGFALAVLFAGGNLALAALLAYLLYLIAIEVAARIVEGSRQAADRRASNLIVGAFALALIPLGSVTWSAISKGMARFDVDYFTMSMRNVVGPGGGALHAITGTLFVTGAAAAISVPIGLLAAIYLAEYGAGKRLAKAITFFVDVMTGVPSIVAGLFAYALMTLIIGPNNGFGLSGSVALSVLMIPVVVRSSEELLRLVPNELREASYALGVPKWLTITRVVLPTAVSGIISGVILAIARVIGETAPLLVAAGFTASMNNNLFANPMMTLPVYVYDSYQHPGVDVQVYLDRAWAGALTLILIVMLLNLIGRLIARRFAPKTGH
ncbi:phosphate ABC transporter permease PstA [Propionicimonas sp.]|uniref:phosphate ABC transporter permease PstA n=1 Tax=Propionicimonas sp. TaxID=1955623 RepID=UPI0017A09B4B|nr:phosphate ABC transporter permease PstA [Propionicimonas sp.]MBU3975488.1 phosphate ABC transporter permease PstA [Actinomycetota bacterium]MBA3020106.1 phosphate ABC transporter permease PstA [Propionicimonas sp.]MBU3986363.1 phosphate ABC transporter permease PstA [Actinomycetota bacterium]MBU4007932.1 phosphate ABC transporter permease PstA [Actinomycetota bacterium]MBU4064190.1 phosphate ABC transporter permease PstA [Actinomycetota bacterium]